MSFNDGRRCRMLRHTSRSKYCVHHLRKLRQLKEVERVALDLFLPISNGFVPANALTQSLSRLFAYVGDGSIKPKDALAMARIAETILKTIPMSTREVSRYLYPRLLDATGPPFLRQPPRLQSPQALPPNHP
jgi:hypothetical protein